MTRVLVLQGPNLNLSGRASRRSTAARRLDEIHAGIATHAAELGLEVDFFQSNHEGALIDRLHRRDFDVAIVNAAGLTHTSIALRDALLAIERPFWEVHLSDPSTREPFRHVNFLHDIAPGVDRGPGRPRLSRRARGDRRAVRGRGVSRRADDGPAKPTPPSATRPPLELSRIRDEIDALDLRIVALLNERAALGRAAGQAKRLAGRRAIHDPEREREVLLRVAMGNEGPLAQADLLSIYRRIVAATRASRRATGTTTGGTATADDAGVAATCSSRGVTGAARPDPRVLPAAPVTRFAPAPTGDLHLGHLVNALYTWGIARATGGRVILRIEDHDRQRSRPEYEAALLDDLERLGLVPDEPPLAAFRAGPTPYRQSDAGAEYEAALDRLRAAGLVYACACSRATFAAYEAERGRPWRGIGCPGGCRRAGTPRGRGHGPAGGRRGRLGALGGPAGRADGRRAGGGRRPPGPRPARQLDVRVLRGRRRHAPRRRPRDPRPRPARRDAGPAAAGAAPRPRDAAAVPPPPARPAGLRPEAVEGRGRHRRCARCSTPAARRPSCSARPASRAATAPIEPDHLGTLFRERRVGRSRSLASRSSVDPSIRRYGGLRSGPRSPTRGRARARRSGGPRTGAATCGRRSASRPTAGAARRASPPGARPDVGAP